MSIEIIIIVKQKMNKCLITFINYEVPLKIYSIIYINFLIYLIYSTFDLVNCFEITISTDIRHKNNKMYYYIVEILTYINLRFELYNSVKSSYH